MKAREAPHIALSARRAERLLVLLGLESHEQLSAHVEYRPLDHGRLREHQRDCLPFGKALSFLLGQRTECGAGAVEQRLPTHVASPALERAALDAHGLVVVEAVGDAALVEPGTRLLHGVAVLDAVDRDRLRL